MFVIWLIGLALAALAPVIAVVALSRLRADGTRAAAARVLLGGTIGAGVGFVASSAIEFIAERSVTQLADYWYAQVAAGFTLGALVAMAMNAARIARARAAELL